MDAIPDFARQVMQVAGATGQRRALVLAGERAWSQAASAAILAQGEALRYVWIGDAAPEGVAVIASRQALKWLGRESDVVVFDAWAGFDVDAFGAIAGTICAGGLLIILCPGLDAWPTYPDPDYRRLAVYPYTPEQIHGRFLTRLIGCMHKAAGVYLIRQDQPLPLLEAAQGGPAAGRAGAECRTADQAMAVEAIMKVVSGHRRRPVVLTSDRGRGKSSALGIAAANLLQQATQRIVVTGPRLDAVQAVFEHAAALLPGAQRSRASVHWQGRVIEYAPPDELSLTPVAADLLLVDEAAAIPGPMLEKLLQHYSRIAFATTIHGYEGTGRGFAVRFQKTLDRHTPDWRAVRMEQPIRWAQDDPLEAFIFNALSLNATPADDAAIGGLRTSDITIEWLDRDALPGNESLLNELFGLLVLAHYRTAPSDLRNLLDGPNISVVAAKYHGHIVATALLAEEGGFDAQMARQIWAGKRRPHGHLIPQSLAAHLSLEDAPLLRGTRVMRIAVHPAVQQRGLGTRLMQAIGEKCQQANLDFIGASFGATLELLQFWQRLGMQPVRVGISRDHSSGAHSVIVLKALNRVGENIFIKARERFFAQLPLLYADPLRELDAELAAGLMLNLPSNNLEPGDEEVKELLGFAKENRGFEFTLPVLYRFAEGVMRSAELAPRLSANEKKVLVMKLLQKRSWQAIAHATGLHGKAAIITQIKNAVLNILK